MVAASANLIVLDTDVVSYIFDQDNTAAYYRQRIEGRRTVISFQTLEESWYGAYSDGWGDRRTNELARHLEQYQVIWPSVRLVEICAQLRSERRAAGREIQSADAWIAATAILLDCPLASHDRGFVSIPGLKLIQAL